MTDEPEWVSMLLSKAALVYTASDHEDRFLHHPKAGDQCGQRAAFGPGRGARLQAHRLVDVVADFLLKGHRSLRDRGRSAA